MTSPDRANFSAMFASSTAGPLRTKCMHPSLPMVVTRTGPIDTANQHDKETGEMMVLSRIRGNREWKRIEDNKNKNNNKKEDRKKV